MRVYGAVAKALLLFSVTSAYSKPSLLEGRLDKSDIPNSGNEWQSLENGVEFQPALHDNETPEVRAALRHVTRRMISLQTYSHQEEFVDGTETYYDDNAQAWRLLGFYIDCNSREQTDAEVEDEEYRELDENGEYKDDEYGDDGYNNEYATECARYLMWAAYVDIDYEGGGIGEYRQLDQETKQWDSTPCDYSTSGRCVKMDCHDKYSNFKLLGIFKEPNFDSWFADLTRHQGYCVWSSDDYNLVQKQRGIWPLDCTLSTSMDEKGNALYYHTKPVRRGRIEIGLYTDSACRVDYKGDISAEEVLNNALGTYEVVQDDYINKEENAYNENENGDDAYDENDRRRRKLVSSIYSKDSIEKWNKAFDTFKVCQPCKAYDMTFTTSGSDIINTCLDSTGLTGVNQCQRFAENTNMYTADYQDVVLASEQGTIVPVKLYGRSYGKAGFSAELSWTIIIFIVSFGTMMVSFVTFCWVRRTIKDSHLDEPLMASKGMVVA